MGGKRRTTEHLNQKCEEAFDFFRSGKMPTEQEAARSIGLQPTQLSEWKRRNIVAEPIPVIA